MLIVHFLVLFVDSSYSGIPTTSNVIAKNCMQDGGYVRLKLINKITNILFISIYDLNSNQLLSGYFIKSFYSINSLRPLSI